MQLFSLPTLNQAYLHRKREIPISSESVRRHSSVQPFMPRPQSTPFKRALDPGGSAFGGAAEDQYSGSGQQMAEALMAQTVSLGTIHRDFLYAAAETGGLAAADLKMHLRRLPPMQRATI